MSTVRICAVGLAIDATRTSTVSHFLDTIAARLDDEVRRHPHAPTLVSYPEHTGLAAMLVGPRAEQARQRLREGGATLDVLMALAVGYGEVLGHEAERFPEARSAGQLLHLACADVVVRTLVDGFSGLAAERGLWLSVGAALPDWERAAADDPFGRSYVASSPRVRNRNLLISPDDGLVTVHDKVYLVPTEADHEQGLGLHPASLAEVAVAELPVGRLGTVISKDAWMPDVNERLDQLGAQLLVQPEAFDRWGLVDRDGEVADLWPPDKFQRSGWWMVQRHPSLRASVAPMLLGHLGELSFDGQPLIAVPSPAGRPGLGLLGQPADRGWAAVGPWAGVDGELADPDGRARFEAAARRRAPGSGDPSEGVVSEATVWADVILPDRPPPTASVARPARLPASVEVAPQPAAGPVQLVPDLTSDGDAIWLTWIAAAPEDARGPQTQAVHLARWRAHGWIAPVRLSPGPETDAEGPVADRRWRPRVAVHDDQPVVLHLGFPNDNWEMLCSRHDGADVRVDDAHDRGGVLRERLHDAPVLRTVGDRLLAVWSDLRWPWVLPQLRAAWSDDGGLSWSGSVRVDGGSLDGQPDPLAPRSPDETSGQTAPTVALVSDEVLVAWQERDRDGCPVIRFGGPGRIPSTLAVGEGGERVARPALLAMGSRVWLVWERWEATGGAALLARCSEDGGGSWSVPWSVDPTRPTGVTQRNATLLASGAPDAPVLLVAEDDRHGTRGVVAATIGAQGADGRPIRLDDAPAGTDALAPTATVAGHHLVVAWQDTRDGADRLRTLRAALDDVVVAEPSDEVVDD